MPHGRPSCPFPRLGHLTAAGTQRPSLAPCKCASGYEDKPPTHFTLGLVGRLLPVLFLPTPR